MTTQTQEKVQEVDAAETLSVAAEETAPELELTPAELKAALAAERVERAAEKQALQKAQNDLKAAEGRNRPADEIRAIAADLKELKARFAQQSEIMKALAPEEAKRIEEQFKTAENQDDLNEMFNDSLFSVARDSKGELRLPKDHPVIVELDKAYQRAVALPNDRDGKNARRDLIKLAGLKISQELTRQAEEAQAERDAKHKAEVAEAEKRGEEREKKKYIAKVNAAPGGLTGGGGGVADKDVLAAYAKDPTSVDFKRVQAALARL